MATVEAGTPKAFRAGTHRLIPPEDTVDRMRPFLSRMGITRIANVTGLDCIGIPVVMVVRPNGRAISVSQGKGLTLDAARASGLMESVEAFQGERITLPLLHGSVADLQDTFRLVDVTALPRKTASLFNYHRPLSWIEGYDLLRRERVWVPYELVHVNYTLHSGTETGNFAASSNGLASGNHLLEAMSHGICEVVERDCTALWKVAGEERRNTMRINLDTVDDAGCRLALDAYERAGVRVAVWESTSHIGLPTFECLIVDGAARRPRDLYPAGGSGCHPVREIALLRALTEAAQSRVTYISGARDDAFRADYERHSAPDAIARLRAQMDRPATRSFHDAPTFEGETFEEDVAWELNRLRGCGIERAIVFDLSMPEFGVSVVRMVIPGLELFGTLPGVIPGRRVKALMRKPT